MRVNAKDFVRCWQQSNSVSEVAEKLGMNEQAVYQRARYISGKGVFLKEFTDGRHNRVDYAELQAIAEEALIEV